MAESKLVQAAITDISRKFGRIKADSIVMLQSWEVRSFTVLEDRLKQMWGVEVRHWRDWGLRPLPPPSPWGAVWDAQQRF
ncbi:MAG: hypothetical protein WDW38_009175 [Sanguina aurantia]